MSGLAEQLDELDLLTGSSPPSTIGRVGSDKRPEVEWSPPSSPPDNKPFGQPLARVSSGVMSIPTSADGAGNEGARPQLVGPTQLPQVDPPAVELGEAGASTQLDSPDIGNPRKFTPSDFDILSLVGQVRTASLQAARAPTRSPSEAVDVSALPVASPPAPLFASHYDYHCVLQCILPRCRDSRTLPLSSRVRLAKCSR